MSPPASGETELSAEAPNFLRYRGNTATIGPKGYGILVLLLKSPDVPEAEAQAKVWGTAGPPSAVRGCVVRLNAALMAVGCPACVGQDRGRIKLTWPPAPPATAAS